MPTTSSKSLNNLEKHQVGTFTIPLFARRENIEETITIFDSTRGPAENSSILIRATHLYMAIPEKLEQLRQSLLKNQNFVHVELLHQSSDIGLTHKIFVRHKSGKELYYDGIMYRLTEVIHADDFGLDEIEKLAGYKGSFDPIVVEFENSLMEVIPLPHIYSHSSLNFYTASPKSWEEVGIKAEGDPHLRLACKDMNIITITALIFSEAGKNYYVYLGERTSTLQMIAHETFISMELRSFIAFVEEKRKTLHTVKKAMLEELNGAIAPLYKLGLKHKNWNSIKNSWKTLGEIRKTLAQFDLLVQAYEHIVENRWAFFNGPRQIWLADEEKDEQEQIQHPCPNFFNAKVENSSITDVSEKPDKPMYTGKTIEIKNLITTTKDELEPILGEENTLLTIFQTEFSLYAVWLAVVALVISLVSIIISILISSD
jgi:hypothetical protein